MSTPEVIADFPGFVNAVVIGDELHLMTSAVVRESDPHFAPVRDALTERYWTLISSEAVEAEELWFGEGWFVSVRLEGPRTGPKIEDLFKELSMN